MRTGVVERYANALYGGNVTERWWAHDRILVGGSLLSSEDWEHLERDHGCTHVVNVETEHGDDGKCPLLVEARVPDNGASIPSHMFRRVLTFALAAAPVATFYVHCQMGGSRSPAFAYYLMRRPYEMSGDDALATLRASKPGYGDHPYHRTYIACAEAAIAEEMSP